MINVSPNLPGAVGNCALGVGHRDPGVVRQNEEEVLFHSILAKFFWFREVTGIAGRGVPLLSLATVHSYQTCTDAMNCNGS